MSSVISEMQSAAVIQLPQPVEGRAASVFEALKKRKTLRQISAEPLPLNQLSNLLWAACGINRIDGPAGLPGRTAASASNAQEIQVYVALASGVYLYDESVHQLICVTEEDLRRGALTPGQPEIEIRAPVQLIYVADINRLKNARGFHDFGLQDAEVQMSYYYVDTGLIAGNVYLFAAAQGLAAWFHNCHRTDLERRLRLRLEQRVLFAHSIGYPDTASTLCKEGRDDG